MTAAADDRTVEEAFEALLAGRDVPDEAAALAGFARDVRAVADGRPGRPNVALAELLTTGLLTDLSSPSTRTAEAASSPRTRRARGRKRSRVPMFLSALIAKFLSAGAVAQAATGAGIVVVAFTGAGTAGVLPGPVQETFSDTVGIESPQPVPGEVTFVASDDETADDPGETVDAGDVAGDDGTAPVEPLRYDPGSFASFGEYVSLMARQGGVDGAWISEQARNKHRQGDTQDDATETGATETEAPTDAGDPVSEEPEDDATVQRTDRRGNGNGDRASGNRGNGNDGDRGNGNRGNGNGRP